MDINLPFKDKNNNPLPGGICYLSRDKGLQATFARGSRTEDLSDLIDLNTPFRLASISKQYTAAAVLYSEARGKLKLSDPLRIYFPSLPDKLSRITIRQLLTHTSGITDYETLIPSGRKKQVADRDVLSLINTDGRVYFSPGSRFRYSNTGYCLLALVIEKTWQMLFPQFMDQHIFRPLELQHTTIYEPGKKIMNSARGFKIMDQKALSADQNITSATQGDGGVYTSPIEYARWIDRLFSQRFIQNYDTLLFGPNKVSVKEGIFYNMGWFLGKEQDGTRCVFHSGESTGFRNIVYYNINKCALKILFSNVEGKENELAALFESFFTPPQLKYTLSAPLMEWMSSIYN